MDLKKKETCFVVSLAADNKMRAVTKESIYEDMV